MALEINNSAMEIFTRASMLMDCLKDSVSTSGLMAASTKATSNKDSEAGMACGMRTIPSLASLIRDTTPWTRSQPMGCTSGRTDGYTKATSRMIIGMGMGSSSKAKNACTGDIGSMANKPKLNQVNNFNILSLLPGPQPASK